MKQFIENYHIPDSLYIGVKLDRHGVKQAFITEYGTDSNSKKRCETVDNWTGRGNDSYVTTVKNEAKSGYKIIGYGSRYSTDNKVVAVESPEGYVFQLYIPALVDLLKSCVIKNGSIENKLVFGRANGYTILVEENLALKNSCKNVQKTTGELTDEHIGNVYKILHRNIDAEYLGSYYETQFDREFHKVHVNDHLMIDSSYGYFQRGVPTKVITFTSTIKEIKQKKHFFKYKDCVVSYGNTSKINLISENNSSLGKYDIVIGGSFIGFRNNDIKSLFDFKELILKYRAKIDMKDEQERLKLYNEFKRIADENNLAIYEEVYKPWNNVFLDTRIQHSYDVWEPQFKK